MLYLDRPETRYKCQERINILSCKSAIADLFLLLEESKTCPGVQCAQITVPVLTRPQSSLINALGAMKKPGASQLPAPVCGKRRLVN